MSHGRLLVLLPMAWLLAATTCQHAPDHKALSSQLNQTFRSLSREFTEWTDREATEIELETDNRRAEERTKALEQAVERWWAIVDVVTPLLVAYEQGNTKVLEDLELWLGKAKALLETLR